MPDIPWTHCVCTVSKPKSLSHFKPLVDACPMALVFAHYRSWPLVRFQTEVRMPAELMSYILFCIFHASEDRICNSDVSGGTLPLWDLVKFHSLAGHLASSCFLVLLSPPTDCSHSNLLPERRTQLLLQGICSDVRRGHREEASSQTTCPSMPSWPSPFFLPLPSPVKMPPCLLSLTFSTSWLLWDLSFNHKQLAKEFLLEKMSLREILVDLILSVLLDI